MFKLGLTGSIGMGKSTTAQFFAESGCAVWDADAAVHRLYSPGGAGVACLQDVVPAAIVDNAVSRDVLRDLISKNASVLKMIEKIVHPLVRQDREAFAEQAQSDILVFDIPLLFETGSEREFDAVACVYVDEKTQRTRVLERGTMNDSQFNLIKSKQMPIQEKLDRADFCIETDTLQNAKQQVSDIVSQIRQRIAHA